MKNKTFLIVAAFLFFNTLVKSQTIQDSSSISKIENPMHLTTLLQKHTKYPREALFNDIQGDVVLSFIINHNANLDSLMISSSPDILLSTSSIVAYNSIEKELSTYKIKEKPIDLRYLIVFRYRLYLNTQPPKHKEKAEDYIEKQKYNKAIKCFDKAIKDNKYDFELYKSRSKVKEITGDIKGSKQDSLTSNKIKSEIISVVNIIAIGNTTVIKRSIGFTTIPNR